MLVLDLNINTEKQVESVLMIVLDCSLTRRFDVGDQSTTLFFLLQACKNHLCSWYILLWVCKVDFEGLLVPADALVNVSLGVVKSSCSSCLPSPDSVKVGPLLMLASSFHSVALGTGLGENLFTRVSTHFIWKRKCLTFLSSKNIPCPGSDF